ncbi:hypothetical protein [Actinomadura madurae]|uniref:hypothetical protein n=1 Tax=Actinomadura madurae TaxID=1993 RepID=UPI0020D20BCC|nr:hypothetical protein [Actinomadura madurae]MCP9984090.1 hypothetical protein [Actinomadura madurae]
MQQDSGRVDKRAMAAATITVVFWASAFVAIRSAGAEYSPGALALGGSSPGRSCWARSCSSGARDCRPGAPGPASSRRASCGSVPTWSP